MLAKLGMGWQLCAEEGRGFALGSQRRAVARAVATCCRLLLECSFSERIHRHTFGCNSLSFDPIDFSKVLKCSLCVPLLYWLIIFSTNWEIHCDNDRFVIFRKTAVVQEVQKVFKLQIWNSYYSYKTAHLTLLQNFRQIQVLLLTNFLLLNFEKNVNRRHFEFFIDTTLKFWSIVFSNKLSPG